MKKAEIKDKSMILLLIPLLLSAYTHLWNPTGFPGIWVVEGQYLQRAMYVLEGQGLHEPIQLYEHPYDHPYFGQIFLAGLLALSGYQYSLGVLSDSTDITAGTITQLHLVPKLIMGILAIIDTFLLYKITEKQYGKNVALVASVLFAVMPITWVLRKILLESLLLPFLLSSILLAIYVNTNYLSYKTTGIHKIKNVFTKPLSLVLISGVFLGLCIFTKLPLLTMAPLLAYIIYKKGMRLRYFSLWVVPLILIPLIWPIHALLIGEINLWIKDIEWNSQREDLNTNTAMSSILINSLKYLYLIDPVLLISGLLGILYAFIKRDYFILLWTIPLLLFLFAINFVSFFHLIPIIPAFCIASAKMLVDLLDTIKNGKIKQLAPIVVISVLGLFGLTSTTILITSNVNTTYFNIYASLTDYLIDESKVNDGNSEKKDINKEQEITIIGRHWTRSFYWIPKFVFDLEIDFKKINQVKDIPLPQENDKIVLIVDGKLHPSLEKQKYIDNTSLRRVTTPIATFTDTTMDFNTSVYPFASMSLNKPISGKIQLKEYSVEKKSIFE